MANFFKKFINKGDKNYIEKVTENEIAETQLNIEDLNDNEKKFIKNNFELATEILKALDIVDEPNNFSPKSIDLAIKTWFTGNLEGTLGIGLDVYSDALACAWGEYLEKEIGMKWQVITDNFGTEIGLYHKKNDVTIFPFSSVSKAFDQKAYDLISMITQRTFEVLENQ